MRTFIISDTHFGHKGITDFEHSDGTPMRPFASWQEADMTMVDNWNKIVKPGDKVYHLGDVAFSRLGLDLVKLLNGRINLVRGNHDDQQARRYLEVGFRNIYGVKQINGVWLTHMPMHEMSAGEDRVKLNVHGHLHRNKVPPSDEVDWRDGIDEHPKYFNACVEQINYTPMDLDMILAVKGIE